MMKKILLCVCILLCIVGWGPLNLSALHAFFQDTYGEYNLSSQSWIQQAVLKISMQASNLDPRVLKVGLIAYLNARHRGLDNKEVLTLVDYSKPSIERRLWVIDVKNLKVLFNTWVAHGKNSGAVNATSFSNRPGSLKSSLGVFLTDNTYIGDKGYALRIKGLEDQNNNAFDRNIVVHGAPYVGADVVKNNHMLGRSFGCFAVSPQVIKPLINTIKDKTLMVAYYPDEAWLKHSTFTRST